MDNAERTLTILLPFQTSTIKIEGEGNNFRQFSPLNHVPANDFEIGMLMQGRDKKPVTLQFLNSEFLTDAQKSELVRDQQDVAVCPDDKKSVIIDQNFHLVFEP